MHEHDHQVDSFYVLEGELDLTIEDSVLAAGPEMLASVPRGVRHTFNHSRPGTARVLNAHAPDGASPTSCAGARTELRRGEACSPVCIMRLISFWAPIPSEAGDSLLLGLILAVGSAFGTNLGFLFKHRGAVLAPPIRVRHPVRSAVGLFRSRWFAVGWLVSVVAWGLHVGALSLAPCPPCRRSCPEGWSSWRCSPSESSGFPWDDASGSA